MVRGVYIYHINVIMNIYLKFVIHKQLSIYIIELYLDSNTIHMCFHTFIQTNQHNDIYYCSTCNCLLINNYCLTTFKPASFKQVAHIDPLDMFTQCIITHHNNMFIPLNTTTNAINSNLYLQTRSTAINAVKYISTTYGLDEHVYHSSIYICDYLYLKMNFTEDVQLTAVVAVVLLTKYKHNGKIASVIEHELIYKNERYYTRYKDIEIKILKCLNYDLSMLTAFDVLNMLLWNGIAFEEEVSDMKGQIIDKMYLNCVIHINNFVEKKNYVNYSPIEIAFAIVVINRELYGLKRELNRIFSVIYNISENSYQGLLHTLLKKNKRNTKCVSTSTNSVIKHN